MRAVLVVSAQQVLSVVALQVPPHRMNVIHRPLLPARRVAVVELDEECGAMNAVVVRLSGLRARPRRRDLALRDLPGAGPPPRRPLRRTLRRPRLAELPGAPPAGRSLDLPARSVPAAPCRLTRLACHSEPGCVEHRARNLMSCRSSIRSLARRPHDGALRDDMPFAQASGSRPVPRSGGPKGAHYGGVLRLIPGRSRRLQDGSALPAG